MEKLLSLNNFAALLGVSRKTVDSWIRGGKLVVKESLSGSKHIDISELDCFPEIKGMKTTLWEDEARTKPNVPYSSVELFAGGGGLALGMEMAGFQHVLLNEYDHNACDTLRANRPNWNVVEGDIHELDFTPFRGKVDFLSGGFPCQAFSYAGKRLGFEETRGTLFFEMARAIKEIEPKVFMAENVRGLLEHDGGRTLGVIRDVIKELGYTLIDPKVLRAIQYNVPQKRERLILLGIRDDISPYVTFRWPDVAPKIRTLRDAFYSGDLYPVDVPASSGQTYTASKYAIMSMVPEGGDWRDLPEDVARDYMKGSYGSGGGKTGMARRLSLDEPSLTLTCAPAQKQTERCHPIETRPLTVREYARIQTFPDEWTFCGSLCAQYKQIGNAVPVNMAWALGRAVIRLFNDIYSCGLYKSIDSKSDMVYPRTVLHGLFEGMACEKDFPYGIPKQYNKDI